APCPAVAGMARLWRRSRTVFLAMLLLAALSVGFWLCRPDPKRVATQRLEHHLASEEARRLPPAEQLALRSQLRSELQQLSPRQRRLLRDERRRLLVKRIARFRALSRAEQIAFLDREIDRLIALRRQAAAAGEPAGTAGRGTSGNADDRERALKQRLDTTTPAERAMLGDYGKQILDRARMRGVLGADLPDDLRSVIVFY